MTSPNFLCIEGIQGIFNSIFSKSKVLLSFMTRNYLKKKTLIYEKYELELK